MILGTAAFFLGPDKLTDMAKEAGKQAGELKAIPKEFNEGLQNARPSEAFAETARQLGRDAAELKTTVQEVVPDVKEAVATVKSAAQEVNSEFVAGVSAANSVTEDVQKQIPKVGERVRSEIGTVKDAGKAPAAAPAAAAAAPPASPTDAV